MTQSVPAGPDDLCPPTLQPPLLRTLVARIALGGLLLMAASAVWLLAGRQPPAARLDAATSIGLLPAILVIIACLATILVLDHRLARARLTQAHATKNAALFAQALDALPIGLQIKDAELRYVWVNAEHSRRSGYTRSDLLGRTVTQVVPDAAFAQAVTDHDRRVIATGKADGPHEQVIPGPDGNIAHITLTTKVPLISDGTVTHILSVSADLTAMRDDQRRAEEARRLLETVLDVAPVAVLVSDREGTVQWANHAVHRLFGHTTDIAKGAPLAQLAGAARITAATADLLAGQQSLVTFEHTVPADNESVACQMLITMVPVYGAEGQIQQILTIATDVTDLKAARFEADTANRLIESILRNVPLSIQVKDADHRFRWVNQTYADLVGRDGSDLLGKTVHDLGIAPENARLADALDDEVMAANETMRLEQVWGIGERAQQMMVIKAPILDDAAKATHVITIGVDVSELNRLRAQADDARHVLQAVLDAVPVSIALKDRERRYQWVNRTFMELVPGRTPADVIGRRLEDFHADPAFAQAARQLDLDTLKTGADVPILPEQHRSPTGETRDFSIRRQPFRGPDGAINGIIILGIDVTDLLRATNELRDINATLERRIAERAAELAKVNTLVATVIENAPVPIIIYGDGARIVRWNPAAEQVLGYTEAEMLTGATSHRPPDEIRQWDEVRQSLTAGNRLQNREVVRRHKDGRDLILLLSAAPLRGPDGRVEGAVAILQDLTDLRATERQLRQAQKMEALGQLTGGVAHDFNNLLGVIIGNLELLQQGLPAAAAQQALATEAIEAAIRGANLVHRLLAFARQQTLRPIATDIGRLITGMRSLLQRAVGEAVTIDHVANGDPWLALVDPNQLENAVLNLSVNARDAMPNGGTLTIATDNVVVDRAQAAMHDDLLPGEYVCLTVSDNGCGIPPEIQTQVFEPFFTTKEVGKGSGLGLSMVFGFVKQSGGHVRLESQPGRGTSIALYLPRVIGEVQDRTPLIDLVGGNGETILLVEDNAQLRRTSVVLLTALGYRVLSAEDAVSARRLFRLHPEVALLFTDIILPGGVSGFDLARQMRDIRPDLPVLFTSGFAEPSMARDSGFQGPVEILDKPFRRGELAQKLRASLTRHP